MDQGKAIAAMLGQACGGAVGVSTMHRRRGSFAPVTDMRGGGPFGLMPGQFSGDVSLSLCTAESLIANQPFDPTATMRSYLRWFRRGHLSSNGLSFGFSPASRSALETFEANPNAVPGNATVGSDGEPLLRSAPVAIIYRKVPPTARDIASRVAKLTHGHPMAADATKLAAIYTHRAFEGTDRFDILMLDRAPDGLDSRCTAVAEGAWLDKREWDISADGSAAGVLEAALWCVATTESFREAVLRATNLGQASHTTAALAGQIAGAFYGFEAIPKEWLAKLSQAASIQALAVALYRKSHTAAARAEQPSA